ncbi:hypothetical protein EXIGLDRAFT_366879 [Exidia glandulosa HHB12029]|uniref:Secreted protein n=1 Tax=Exidia glandulosa HHB12029 TaxID=1314781 RepID=A0A165L770_EXIGL|nr:hypothetical protein EXIGLDRAFT_366879 [Exidia glandulosa HHB12029]
MIASALVSSHFAYCVAFLSSLASQPITDTVLRMNSFSCQRFVPFHHPYLRMHPDSATHRLSSSRTHVRTQSRIVSSLFPVDLHRSRAVTVLL